MAIISEQFIEVGKRKVFMRYAGPAIAEAPAVLLLHQSPQNSRALIPWIERLSEKYSVFAPDTPGFGFSDPLPMSQPSIPDYAAALHELLQTLGLARTLVYGVHTGAVTALRFSLDFPACVAALVCDGYARFDAAERQNLLGDYLPPFEPKWDGTHLLWLWARFREQHLYFPWHVSTKESRLAYPLPATLKLNADIMDVLDAGDGYRIGYRAPFLYDDPTAASRLTVPSSIFYRAEDVLAPHLERSINLPNHVSAERLAGGAAALIERTDAVFALHAQNASLINVDACVKPATSATRFIVKTVSGHLACRAILGDKNNTEIYLHDIGVPAAIPADVGHGRYVLAPELPGHGASRSWLADTLTVENIATAIIEAANQIGLTNITIRAVGGSAAIAVLLANKLGKLGASCKAITLIQPIYLSVEERKIFLDGLPDMTPHSTGAHLLAAWNWARLKHLFWPWRVADGKAARKIDAPAPYRVHADTVEMLRAGDGFAALWHAVLQINLAAALSALRCDVEVVVAVEVIVPEEPELIRLAQKLALACNLKSTPTMTPGGMRWQSQI